MTNWTFYRLLHAREMNTTLLAELVGTGRGHLSEVLNNKPGRGRNTRRKIFPWILPEEASALGWREEYDTWLRGPAKFLQVNAAMRPEENSGDTEYAGESNTAPPAQVST